MKLIFTSLLLAHTSAIKPSSGTYCSIKAKQSPTPEHLEEDNSDKLLWSIVDTYSQEEFCNGKATGKFFLDRSDVTALAREVVKTHV